MDGFSYVDIFATKGIEYLVVIGFLIVLIFFLRALAAPTPKSGEKARKQENKHAR